MELKRRKYFYKYPRHVAGNITCLLVSRQAPCKDLFRESSIVNRELLASQHSPLTPHVIYASYPS